MKTSRQQILEFIRKQQLVTVSELSSVLHMTDANVRHHLSILEDRGEIEAIGMRSQRGKGRPAKIFSLSQQAKGDNFSRLCSALLDVIPKSVLLDEDHLLIQVVNNMLDQIEPTTDCPSLLSQRLFDAIQHLNKLHYQARWEAHHEAPVIILEHCPYQKILDQHPELCRMDSLLLTNLLGNSVKQTARLEKDKRGAIQCRFRLKVQTG